MLFNKIKYCAMIFFYNIWRRINVLKHKKKSKNITNIFMWNIVDNFCFKTVESYFTFFLWWIFSCLLGVPLTYLNYQSGEPNNMFGAEHCLAITGNNLWNDFKCEDNYYGVCKLSDILTCTGLSNPAMACYLRTK